jgi:hypothetical protein
MMEIHGLRLLGQCDLNGRGDGMQLMTRGAYLYVGHMQPGRGTSILDVSDPRAPRQVGKLPDYAGTWSPKVQIAGDLMLVNYELRGAGQSERAGLAIHDISRPEAPREIAYLPIPHHGVHRMWWTGGRYAYLSAIPEGFNARMLMVVDLADPEHPREAGRWWLPGTREGEPQDWPEGRKHNVHHPVVYGDRAYLGCWDAGMKVLDVSNVAAIREVGGVNWPAEQGGHTHTAMPLPGRGLCVVTDEATADDCQEVTKHVRVVSLADERNPRVLSTFPVPQGDYCARGGRFGPHNVHEHRPGAYVDENLIFVTYYNAGLRVVDISDAAAPREVAWFVPDAPQGQRSCQINDVYVTPEGIIYVSDRVNGGIWTLGLV